MLNRDSNVNGTRTQTHTRVIFVGSPSTVSQGIEVNPTFGLYSTASTLFCIKSTYSDDSLNASKVP